MDCLWVGVTDGKFFSIDSTHFLSNKGQKFVRIPDWDMNKELIALLRSKTAALILMSDTKIQSIAIKGSVASSYFPMVHIFLEMLSIPIKEIWHVLSTLAYTILKKKIRRLWLELTLYREWKK